MIDLKSLVGNDAFQDLLSSCRAETPSDLKIAKRSMQGNSSRSFYLLKVSTDLQEKVARFFRVLLKERMLPTVFHEKDVYIASHAHLIAQYFSPSIASVPMQMMHRDVSEPESLWSLFINTNLENLNTHFENAVAETPVFIYDTHVKHAGPARSFNTEKAMYLKERVQIFFSHDAETLQKMCKEHFKGHHMKTAVEYQRVTLH